MQYALRDKGATLDSRPSSAASGWATFSWPFAAVSVAGPRRTLLQVNRCASTGAPYGAYSSLQVLGVTGFPRVS